MTCGAMVLLLLSLGHRGPREENGLSNDPADTGLL